MAETVQQRAAEVLRAHRLECTGPGEVTCRGCRERGWMSWHEFLDHQAQVLADAGVLAVDDLAELDTTEAAFDAAWDAADPT